VPAAAAALEPENTLAQQIVTDHLKQLQNKQYREISRALNRPLPAVLLAVEVIKRCDPRPGLRYNRTQSTPIEPDVFFAKVGNEYQVLLSEDDLPQLRLSPLYRRLLDRRAAPPEVRNYVKERFASAVQLLKNIQQRKHTIQRVCEIIVERQREFLDHGLDQMKPLMIKEVAEQVGVHPSNRQPRGGQQICLHAAGRHRVAAVLLGSGGRPGGADDGAADGEAPGEKDDRGRSRRPSVDR
jgi:RNA polymerase sigma-54 factor